MLPRCDGRSTTWVRAGALGDAMLPGLLLFGPLAVAVAGGDGGASCSRTGTV